MGRTLPTTVQLLHMEMESWKHFRRALRNEDREAYDVLWRYCRRHVAPIAMGSRPVPMEALFMAMLVGLARRVMDDSSLKRGKVRASERFEGIEKEE